MKHGFRLSSAGIALSIGREDTHGVPAPPERMMTIDASEFGASYLVSEPVGESKRHLRLSRVSRAWAPHALVMRLQLIGMAVENFVGFARILSEVDATTVKFGWPNPLEAFDRAPAQDEDGFSCSFGAAFGAQHIREFSREEILRVYGRPRG